MIPASGRWALVLAAAIALGSPDAASAQAPVKAVVPVSKPAWSKGIQPLTRESRW